MSWITWIIIGLIILSYVQYTFPEKVNPYIGAVWDKVNEFVKYKPSKCTSENDPVCANNITYTNSCYAKIAGVLNAVKGECK